MVDYMHKVYVLLASLVLDMIFNAITPSVQGSFGIMGAFAGVQCFAVLAVAIIMYLLASSTLLFKAGNFLAVLKLFRLYLLITALHLGLLAVPTILRFLTVVSNSTPSTNWDQWYYWIVFYLQQIMSIIYYVGIARTCIIFSDGKLVYPQVRTKS